MEQERDQAITEIGGLPDSPPCAHETLLPCWDEAERVHLTLRASSYWCEACGTPFTTAEAEEVERTRVFAA